MNSTLKLRGKSGMLVLSRAAGERIMIDDDVVITFLGLERGRAKIGIVAPPHVRVMREELLDPDGADGKPGSTPIGVLPGNPNR